MSIFTLALERRDLRRQVRALQAELVIYKRAFAFVNGAQLEAAKNLAKARYEAKEAAGRE